MGKRKKSLGTRSSEYGGCGKGTICFLANSSWTRTDRFAGALLRHSSGCLQQNFMFAFCSGNILKFCRLHSTALQNRDCSSTYSVCMQLPLARTREELTCHHPIKNNLSTVVNASNTMHHELSDFTHGLLYKRPHTIIVATLFEDSRHGYMSIVSVYKISFYCSILLN